MKLLGNLLGGVGKTLGGVTGSVGGLLGGVLAPWAMGVAALVLAALIGVFGTMAYKLYDARSQTKDCRNAATEHAAADLKAEKERLETVRAQEREMQTNFNTALAVSESLRMEAEGETARLLARLNNPADGMRSRFKCPAVAANPSAVPGAPRSPADVAAQSAGGLQKEDGEFLVRYAADADKVAHDYNTCANLLWLERQEHVK